jgi:hypothetical protein
MFDEAEFKELDRIYGMCLSKAKSARTVQNTPVANINQEIFKPLVYWHEQYTGSTCSIEGVRHHRLLLYGPPCGVCGKPLRSPRAKRCAECGTLRQT